jgi:hypothetical protein
MLYDMSGQRWGGLKSRQAGALELERTNTGVLLPWLPPEYDSHLFGKSIRRLELSKSIENAIGERMPMLRAAFCALVPSLAFALEPRLHN